MTQAAGAIKRRLQSLKDIRHLLRSIRAMSAIRWRRARMRVRSAEEYAGAVDQQLALATTFATALTRGARYAAERGATTTSRSAAGIARESIGLITLTSDRGLCGAFNVGLVAHALDFIALHKEHEIKIIALGGYGERLFRRAGTELLYTQRFPFTHAVSFVEAREITAKIKGYYEAGTFDSLYLIYNQFVSFGRYRRVEMRLLPPDLTAIWRSVRDASVEGQDLVPEDLILGTPPQNLQDFLLSEHLTVQIYLALIESMVSEESARLQTMDAAITNLDDRVQGLQLQYHGIRQESITQQVLEVQRNARGRRMNGS